RTRLAACAETVDCADPGHDQTGAPRGKHRSHPHRAFVRRSPRTGDCSLKDRGARRPVPRRVAKNGGSLSRKREKEGHSDEQEASTERVLGLCEENPQPSQTPLTSQDSLSA